MLGAYGQARLTPVLAPWLVGAGVGCRSRAVSTASVSILIGLTILGASSANSCRRLWRCSTRRRRRSGPCCRCSGRQDLRLVHRSAERHRESSCLKLVGVRNTGHRHLHSPEEIELLIAESRDGGLLEPEEQQRLHRALRLDCSTARELMVPRERMISVDASTADGTRCADRRGEPVHAGCRCTRGRRNIVGMLSGRRMLRFITSRRVPRGRPRDRRLRAPDGPRAPVDAGRSPARLSARAPRAGRRSSSTPIGEPVGLVTLAGRLGELLGPRTR